MTESPSGSELVGVQVSVLSTVAGSGVSATLGALGARLSSVMVAELDAVAELVSVTVTSQVMTSPREAVDVLNVTVDPVPKEEPVVVLVHV